MIMNYDEYIKIVPKETVEFVNLVLKFFDYICKNWNIVIEDKNKNQSEIVIDHFETKIFAILLGVQYYQNPNDKVRIILDNCGLSEDFINSLEIERIKETEVNYNDVFNKTANVFCQCEYYENYMLLMPDEIIINVYTNKKYRVNQMDWIFKNNNW